MLRSSAEFRNRNFQLVPYGSLLNSLFVDTDSDIDLTLIIDDSKEEHIDLLAKVRSVLIAAEQSKSN